MRPRLRRFELLTPTEIIALRDECPLAFQALGPLEWHSYHLPMGSDAIIVDGFAERIGEEVGGVIFPPIWMGLAQWLTEEEKKAWGLPSEAREVLGMNFDPLPLRSESYPPALLRDVLTNRINYARDCGFRLCILVNHHSGGGQHELCREVVASVNLPGEFDVRVLFPAAHTGPGQSLGGHANQDETRAVLGVRPELVKPDNLPDGPLDVWKHGILHSGREIPREENPRLTSYVEARETAKTVVGNCVAVVRRWMGEAGILPNSC